MPLFLGLGIGNIVGILIIGPAVDNIFIYYVKKNNSVQKPGLRLPVMVFSSLSIPIGLFWYGWCAHEHVHFVVPIIGTSFIGFGMISVMFAVQNYLVNAFTLYAASAIAAATILCSIFGACLPLAGQLMYDKLGVGWGNSLLGLIALALTPITWIFWRYGEGIRTRSAILLGWKVCRVFTERSSYKIRCIAR